MMKSEKTPDFRAKCVELKNQVQHLLKRDKLLTDKNIELTKKLSSMRVVQRMMNENQGRYMIVEEDTKSSELVVKFQQKLRFANLKVEKLEEEILKKEKSFEQALRLQKKEHKKLEGNQVEADESREHREKEVEFLKGERQRLEDKMKNLKKQVKDLSESQTIAIAEEEKRNELVQHREKIRESDVMKERKNARQFKEKMEKLIIEKNKLTADLEKQKQDNEIQKKVMCDLKKEKSTLKTTVININTENSKVDQQKEGLIADLEEVIVFDRNNRENQEMYQQNIINTLNEKIRHDSEIQTKLEQKESQLTDIINSNNQEISDLKNLITDLEKNNDDAVAERDLYHQNWMNALTKVDLQDKMIDQLQTKIKQSGVKAKVMMEDLALVKDHHCLVSNRLKNAKRQESESRKALDACETSASRERELGEKKLMEMMLEKEELKRELVRHKELLEAQTVQEAKLKALQEILVAENDNYKKEQEESEQVREHCRQLVLRRLHARNLPPIANNSPTSEDMLKHEPLPPVTNSYLSPPGDLVEMGYISRHTRFPLRPHRKLTQSLPTPQTSRLLSTPSPPTAITPRTPVQPEEVIKK
ncbi:putative leucine-rich repeat-containing protein DDB_G0290503 [Clinocottus analis]|uniref:putative leucine-rich repeat-containing protein DDB_G0290503 n=1 Tax=Clinocottus analis TaxID=304258 RepID=UPI0035BEDC0B